MTEVEKSNEMFLRTQALDYAFKLMAGMGRPHPTDVIEHAQFFETYLKGENNVSRSNK